MLINKGEPVMLNKDLTKAGRLMTVLLLILLLSTILTIFHVLSLCAHISADTGNPYHVSAVRISLLVNLIFIAASTLVIWLNNRALCKEINSLIKEKDKIYADKQRESEFFSNISHELKTPLSVMLGAIQLVESGSTEPTPPPKLSKHLYTIRQNCYRLLRLINNYLDTSRLTTGYIKLNLVNCNIIYLIEEMVQSVVPFAEEKHIHMEFDTQTEEIITAVDIDKIERIMLNLLSNAIKFTPLGGNISVYISSDETSFTISVSDTGPGIPPSMQELIFERFRQVGNALTREQEGSGIGLSLVKSFVDLHNGIISVESTEKTGSTFIIKIPIQLSKDDETALADLCGHQSKIIQAINIEFSDIYKTAS